MAFTKPNVNTPWAETGEIVSPSVSKVAQGWVEEIPDFEFENWIQNRSDQFNAHINQYGFPVWDAVTEYIADKSYAQGSDGLVYRASTTNTNKNPLTNSSDWALAFDAPVTSYTKAESDNKYLTRSNNLSDLNNAATARTNLGVYSKTETDTSYAKRSNNLSDLNNSGSARSNLSVYSKAETDASYAKKSNNLSDLNNSGTARTNLNVYSKSDVYTKAQADSRYVGKSGDTMTGKLTLDSDPTSALHAATKQYADAGGNPPGSVTAFAGNSLPSGYLKCNGALVSRSTYPDLFSAIGTTYGSGDFSTTFRLPELRGEFVRGWDDSRGVDSGRAFGSSQTDEFKSHTHRVNEGGDIPTYSGVSLTSGDDYTTNVAFTQETTATGGDETRPRNIALLYIIKT